MMIHVRLEASEFVLLWRSPIFERVRKISLFFTFHSVLLRFYVNC